MTVAKRGIELLQDPSLNKSTALQKQKNRGSASLVLCRTSVGSDQRCMAGTPASAVEGHLRDPAHVDANHWQDSPRAHSAH
jgi:hypothetical protein